MSEERETPASRAAEAPEAPANLGAPVEETEVSETEVLEAVERATSPSAEPAGPNGEPTTLADEATPAAIAEPGEEVTGEAASARSGTSTEGSVDLGVAPTPEVAEQARRQAISEVDTQLNIDMGAGIADPTLGLDDLPSATEEPARDGEIRIAADHPMAALYMQSPMPPEIRGNRGAGVLIALLGTVGFALVCAGVVALWLAPTLAPSQFVAGLTESLLAWSFIAATIAFFVGLAVLVLIVGRAGWWAYVLGGFFVGVFVWAAATAGLVVEALGWRALIDLAPAALIEKFGVSVPAIAAGVIAREATVWFGAWIGSRGRRMKQRNAEELAAYESALAEVQAKSI
ncbi:hypothetical protein [Leucobacter salsicius]|uniref:hypothetical protein n=1 Tax=Leucobacter salsicius TaxID=664638 RepID=UPI00034A5DA9|nr:hypothetical protein [Leucobacter salsicius]